MKKPTLAVKAYKWSKTHPWTIDLRAFGGKREFYTSKSKAEIELRKHRIAIEKGHREILTMSRHEFAEIADARDCLAKYGKTIRDSANFLIDHLTRVLQHGTTVNEFAEKVVESKRKAGRSDAHVRGLEMCLRKFSAKFGDRPIASITAEDLDEWLSQFPGNVNRAYYRRNVSVLFGAAVKRRMIEHNPVAHTEVPQKSNKAPEIFSPDEIRALLETAQRIEPSIAPFIAIAAFAGLRSDVKASEIARLEWPEVNLKRGFIEVKSAKAKTARRRIVPILPNLAAWLLPYASVAGNVLPEGARAKLERVRKVAGITWKRNGLRHSFASYRLAATNDAPRVAAELGHTSPNLLYNTYRELVLPSEAERYFKTVPPVQAANVVAFASQAQS